MSFDKITRNLLAKTVAVCRRRLIEDVTDQLRGVFGLHPDGTVLPLDKLTHLSPDQAAAARRLRNLLDHYTVSAAGKESDRRKAAYERMVLAISFTVLNRLAALRLCEERGLVIECVRKGTTSAGYQMFERISGGALGGRYDTYQVFLECLFDELALDLGMLFDRLTPQSTIFPTERCMEDVLVELNKPELTHLWTADETIGWIYQYFNPPEERKSMRDASSAPRNSHELAVRNQFFTPRYVVEFLTDNTLGRTWYEMRKGHTTLKEECRYFVRRPNEIFLAQGENAPAVKEKESETDLSQEERLKQPVYIEHRSPKDPRDLHILDPACGSGHFLLYAFDLLERIYEEAWLDPELGPALWKAVGFIPQVDESLSDDVVDPESVRLRPDARPVGEGDCRDLSDCYVVIADLYNTPFLAGRPLVYSGAMCDEKEDRILLKIPAAEFSYRKAVEMGWFANETGTVFLDIYKELFTYSMGGPREGMFEKFDQAARDENLSRLRRAVPKLIIEHNLHGIDIDPRAVQIAAMALWLRAQKTWQRMGLKPTERPTIKKSNIVTAEPMPGEGDLRAEFVASLKPRVLGQIVDVVFERMQLAGEAGSLLKIEEEIREAIAEAKKAWLEPSKEDQPDLFPGTLTPKVEQLSIFDVRDVTDAQFWEQAEDRILAALQVYAERAQNGHAIRRRLFSEDAARGFAFIDLCRKCYDVVLMNPPFGVCAPAVLHYVRRAFPIGYIDLYTAFIDRGRELNCDGGMVGAITSRTGFFLSSFESWRRSTLLGDTRLKTCIDLGQGVLDSAMVETAAYTVAGSNAGDAMLFFRLNEAVDKEAALLTALATPNENVFIRCANQMLATPASTVAYSMAPDLAEDFHVLPSVCKLARIVRGSATGDDERFIRTTWEIPPATLCTKDSRKWRWLSKGGDFGAFYAPIHLVLDWQHDGGYLGEFMYLKRPRNGYLWGPKSWSKEFIGKPGVVWPLRSQKGVSFRVLPADCAFSHKSPAVMSGDETTDFAFLAILNTQRVQRLADCLTTFGSYEMGVIGALPVDLINREGLSSLGKEGYVAVRESFSLVETDPNHILLSRSRIGGFGDLIELLRSRLGSSENNLKRILSAVNACYLDSNETLDKRHESSLASIRRELDSAAILSEFVGIIFGRWDVRYATGEKSAPKLPDPFAPLPVCPPGQLQNEQGLPLTPEDVTRLKAVGCWTYPIDIPWDGILVDDPGFNGAQPHRDDIVQRVREVFDLLWKDNAHEIEQEACDLLDVSDLRDYFRKPMGFFQDHLKRYSKSRRKVPIYWPLSTASGSYTLWLYYHRMTDQTLYSAVNKYIEPKIADIERGIARIENDLKASSGRDATRLTDQLSETLTFLGELRDLREELLHIAALPYEPNLNDGVIINAAPFHKLFRLRSWANDTEDCWKKLKRGDYDWAHLAYTIWPDRVREVCKTDRSIAIAHGLEALSKVEALKKAKSRKRKA